MKNLLRLLVYPNYYIFRRYFESIKYIFEFSKESLCIKYNVAELDKLDAFIRQPLFVFPPGIFLCLFAYLIEYDISAEEEESFFFGLATAPAHVEDRLNDAWLQFAQNENINKQDSTMEAETGDAIMGSATCDGGSQQATTPLKRKKSRRVAMEAKIRGLAKYIEEDESTESEEAQHNVAAWHNVPNP